ncbi:hypothetical protein FocTR4_00000537, partial [Fusarium oxysporum f. sp. cubense]
FVKWKDADGTTSSIQIHGTSATGWRRRAERMVVRLKQKQMIQRIMIGRGGRIGPRESQLPGVWDILVAYRAIGDIIAPLIAGRWSSLKHTYIAEFCQVSVAYLPQSLRHRSFEVVWDELSRTCYLKFCVTATRAMAPSHWNKGNQ